MPDGYIRGPRLIKGALVKLTDTDLLPVPEVVVFQYNPAKISRSMEIHNPNAAKKAGSSTKGNDRVQPGAPGESMSLTLEFDATDALEEPAAHPIAVRSGVADRIAALEMMLYSATEGRVDQGLNAVSSSSFGIFSENVTVVLFVWGPGRVVPVRLTKFEVEELDYSPTLYPIRATVSVGLTVLTDTSFKNGGETPAEEIAVAAYNYTMTQKQRLSIANIANTAESINGMLPL